VKGERGPFFWSMFLDTNFWTIFLVHNFGGKFFGVLGFFSQGERPPSFRWRLECWWQIFCVSYFTVKFWWRVIFGGKIEIVKGTPTKVLRPVLQTRARELQLEIKT
jgi:hypothetical protein